MVKAAKQVKRARRNAKPFIGAIIVVALVGVGLLGYVLERGSGSQVTTVDPNIPVGKAEGYLMGNPDAPVKVIEFGDFECPQCGLFANITEPDIRTRLVNTGMISIRFFDFPLAMHRNTWQASNAAACSADQGKFWEMHDKLFGGQDQWNTEATNKPKKIFKQYAQDIGLNVTEWESCFDSQRDYPRLKGSQAEAERRMVDATPTFIIGNKMIPGNIPYDQFKQMVDEAMAAAKPDSGKKVAPTRKGAAQ